MFASSIRTRPQRGFTLLETLVAFVLLSLALALIMQIFSAGLRRGAVAEQRVEAALIAENLINSVGPKLPLAEGEQSGESGSYRWRVEIFPADLEDETADSVSSPPTNQRLYRIDLLVQWQQGARERQLGLSTLRVGWDDE